MKETASGVPKDFEWDVAGVALGFFRRGLTLLTREIKHGFQHAINAKNLPTNSFLPSDGG